MIDEKKLIEELEKWMNDTAYLKEKYSGATQFKDGTGENIMYAHAEIAHDVISEVIDKINEQQKFGEWIPCSERLPEKHVDVLVDFGDENPIIAWYSHVNDTWKNSSTDYVINVDVIAWQPLPESYNPWKE